MIFEAAGSTVHEVDLSGTKYAWPRCRREPSRRRSLHGELLDRGRLEEQGRRLGAPDVPEGLME